MCFLLHSFPRICREASALLTYEAQVVLHCYWQRHLAGNFWTLGFRFKAKNKDCLLCEAKAKAKDLASEAKAKAKDLASKAKAKDYSFKVYLRVGKLYTSSGTGCAPVGCKV